MNSGAIYQAEAFRQFPGMQVPEPATLLLAACAVLFAAGQRRRAVLTREFS